MSTADNCPTCDRPDCKLFESANKVGGHHHSFEEVTAFGIDCEDHAVDWRKRTIIEEKFTAALTSVAVKMIKTSFSGMLTMQKARELLTGEVVQEILNANVPDVPITAEVVTMRLWKR